MGNIFCSRPRGWLIKAKPTRPIMFGGIFKLSAFSKLYIWTLYMEHTVGYEISPDPSWFSMSSKINSKIWEHIWWLSSRTLCLPQQCTVCGAHCILSHGPTNLLLLLISISVLLIPIYWTNLVIFYLLKGIYCCCLCGCPCNPSASIYWGNKQNTSLEPPC